MKCWWIIPIPFRIASAGEVIVDPFAADLDLALVGPVQAVEHAHERALAGPVLAEEGVDLAAADVEIDVIVGDHPGEALGDARHLEERDVLWSRGAGARGVTTIVLSCAWSAPITAEP